MCIWIFIYQHTHTAHIHSWVLRVSGGVMVPSCLSCVLPPTPSSVCNNTSLNAYPTSPSSSIHLVYPSPCLSLYSSHYLSLCHDLHRDWAAPSLSINPRRDTETLVTEQPIIDTWADWLVAVRRPGWITRGWWLIFTAESTNNMQEEMPGSKMEKNSEQWQNTLCSSSPFWGKNIFQHDKRWQEKHLSAWKSKATYSHEMINHQIIINHQTMGLKTNTLILALKNRTLALKHFNFGHWTDVTHTHTHTRE